MSDEARPVLRVVRGSPTTEELAALVAVVAARSAGQRGQRPPRGVWTDRSRLVRRIPAPGPGAWRSSGWLG